MRIGVLGPLEIDDESARLGVRDRIVLAALTVSPGEVLSAEQLADAVWGETPPTSWSKNLQGCISRLRKTLGRDLIETAGQGSWRPDGRRFALGTADGHVQVFDTAGRLRTEAREARTSVTDVDYASGGQTMAVSDLTGKVALLDVSTWSSAGKPVKLDGPVAGVTLAPDGRTAFVVTRTDPVAPGTVPGFDGWAILDLRTGSVIRTGSLPESDWAFDDFSPDGVHVAASFIGGRVWILDTRTGRSVDTATPTSHAPILWLGWSPDGSRILTADYGGTLGLWDPSTATVRDTVTVPGHTIAAGQFRTGTTDVTVLDASGRVLTWDTRPEHALKFACRMAGRDLTPDEWRTYVGGEPQFEVCPS